MKAYLNHTLLAQTTLDSGSLTMLGVVIHVFADGGTYRGTVFREEAPVARFSLTVGDDCESTAHVNVDLATVKHDQQFAVKTGGAAVFHVSRGVGGYSVRITSRGEKGDVDVFDSRKLQNGDLFAATLIRPGTYRLANVADQAKGEVVVSYPEPSKTPRKVTEPVDVAVRAGAFNPNRITIRAAQGQVYRISSPSRIRLELAEPNDGPQKGPEKTAQAWKRRPGKEALRKLEAARKPAPKPAAKPKAGPRGAR